MAYKQKDYASSVSDNDGCFEPENLTDRGWEHTVYPYHLANGELLYQQNRFDPPEGRAGVDRPDKRYVPSHPPSVKELKAMAPRVQNWFRGRQLVGLPERRILYNLADILTAGPGSTVFVTEGEKNCNDLLARGLLATTVISHSWADECVATLTNFDVLILEDGDEQGRVLSSAAQAKLAKVAKTTRVVPADHLWKHLPPGVKAEIWHNDVSDWIELGGDTTKLLEYCLEIPAEGAISAEPYTFPDEASIPARDYLYGVSVLRRTVKVFAGPGGAGKSAKEIVDALAMASGKDLIGIKPPRPLNVCLVNLEDDANEMARRITAAMKRFGLTPKDVGDRLIVIAKGEIKFKIATQLRNGVVQINVEVVRGFTNFLTEKKIDVLIIDPLRKSHRVSENDTVAMGEVVEAYDDITEACNCAIIILHHTRKGNSDGASIDSVRGASSIVDAARSVEVLEKMTKEQAKKFGVPEERRGFYFRTFSGKMNFGPPSEKSDWFQITSIDLASGDQVGVVVRWHPLEDAIADDILTPTIRREIREAVGTELIWRKEPTAGMYVGIAIGQVLGLEQNDAKVTEVLRKLLKEKVLMYQRGKDQHRNPCMYVVAQPV